MHKNLHIVSKFYAILVIIVFLILIGRLAQIQVYNWDKYYSESEKNRIRDVILEAPRGLILDRNGEILVDNRPSYSVSVIPYEFLKSEKTIKLLATILDTPQEKIKRKIKKDKISNFSPVRIKRQITFEALSDIEENRLDLPGVYYNVESKRYYPSAVKAPHLFGYFGEITSDELAKRKLVDLDYRMGDMIGKNGVEVSFENHLKGSSGVKYIEVDVLGREIRELSELSGEKPVSGKNVYLTIDDSARAVDPAW